MKRRRHTAVPRGFLIPDSARTPSSSSSAPVHTEGNTDTDVVGGELTAEEISYYRVLGVMPSRARSKSSQARPTLQQPVAAKAGPTQEPILVTAPRRDAPTINYSIGAKRTKTIDLDRESLLNQLDNDISAKSAQASNASLLKTWCKFHEERFSNTEAFPLTANSIRAVASMFKARGVSTLRKLFVKGQT